MAAPTHGAPSKTAMITDTTGVVTAPVPPPPFEANAPRSSIYRSTGEAERWIGEPSDRVALRGRSWDARAGAVSSRERRRPRHAYRTHRRLFPLALARLTPRVAVRSSPSATFGITHCVTVYRCGGLEPGTRSPSASTT